MPEQSDVDARAARRNYLVLASTATIVTTLVVIAGIVLTRP